MSEDHNRLQDVETTGDIMGQGEVVRALMDNADEDESPPREIRTTEIGYHVSGPSGDCRSG